MLPKRQCAGVMGGTEAEIAVGPVSGRVARGSVARIAWIVTKRCPAKPALRGILHGRDQPKAPGRVSGTDSLQVAAPLGCGLVLSHCRGAKLLTKYPETKAQYGKPRA